MRILLASWGSSGDLLPFLSLGRALRRRGHTVTLVGNPEWAERGEQAGLRFVPAHVPLAVSPLEANPEIVSDANMGLTSFRILVEKGIAPVLAETYATLEREAADHDLLVAHHFVFPAALIHEKTGIPWATVCLAPGVTPSVHGLPAGNPLAAGSGLLWRLFHGMIWRIGTRLIEPILDPALNRFRAEVGLPPARDHMFSARSRELVLHLYSPHFAPRPADWDSRHAVTGFCFHESVATLPPEVEDFLAAGPAPWLYTLGTTIVAHPRDFYREAAASVAGTGQRAILLTGNAENRPPALPPNVLAVDYLSHSAILPRCAAVAHQCGIGTLASALRAGIPAVACPFAFDQPNNAARARALGVAEIVPRKKRNAAGFRTAFEHLLSSPAPAKARRLGAKIAAEDGPTRACETIEAIFNPHSSH